MSHSENTAKALADTGFAILTIVFHDDAIHNSIIEWTALPTRERRAQIIAYLDTLTEIEGRALVAMSPGSPA